MFVKSLDIKGFRGIRRCEKPIQLSDFTVLIGRNNAGKTSILEALSLLAYHYGSSAYDIQPISMLYKLRGSEASLIHGYSGKAEIEYTTTVSKIKFELPPKGGWMGLYIDNIQYASSSDEGYVQKLSKALGIESPDKESIGNCVLYFPTSSELTSELVDKAMERFDAFVKIGAHAKVVEIINRFVDEEFTEVILYRSDLRLRKILEDKPIYPMVKDLGAGTERFIVMALWLELLKPRLVLIDDLEASAHPSLIREELKWISKGEWQVVLSTHSIDVLNELPEISPKGCKIVQLKRTKEDVLLQQELSLDELEVFLENNTDPRLLVSALGL